MFRWSINEIDETDIDSLIPFVFHYPRWKAKQATSKKHAAEKSAYADEASWL